MAPPSVYLANKNLGAILDSSLALSPSIQIITKCFSNVITYLHGHCSYKVWATTVSFLRCWEDLLTDLFAPIFFVYNPFYKQLYLEHADHLCLFPWNLLWNLDYFSGSPGPAWSLCPSFLLKHDSRDFCFRPHGVASTQQCPCLKLLEN